MVKVASIVSGLALHFAIDGHSGKRGRVAASLGLVVQYQPGARQRKTPRYSSEGSVETKCRRKHSVQPGRKSAQGLMFSM